jgi:hypothetical protein
MYGSVKVKLTLFLTNKSLRHEDVEGVGVLVYIHAFLTSTLVRGEWKTLLSSKEQEFG